MKTHLHILKNSVDSTAIAMVNEFSRLNSANMKVVLIQDGVKIKPTWKGKTYLLKDETLLPSPLPEGIEIIGYGEFVDLMFEADSVVGW